MTDHDTEKPTVFSLEFKTENAAFEVECYEAALILKKLAAFLEGQDSLWYADSRRLMDSNGNAVGEVKVR